MNTLKIIAGISATFAIVVLTIALSIFCVAVCIGAIIDLFKKCRYKRSDRDEWILLTIKKEIAKAAMEIDRKSAPIRASEQAKEE